MEDAFLRSLYVQPPVVFGRQLRPFSAYHAATLMILDSPYMNKNDPEMEDLVFAAWVCTTGFVDGPPQMFPDVDHTKIKIVLNDWDMEKESATFLKYIADYNVFPEIWIDETDSKESGMPWPFHCVATVLQHYDFLDEPGAWDMALNRLISYKCAVAESHGWDIVNQQLIELKETIDAQARAKVDGSTDG